MTYNPPKMENQLPNCEQAQIEDPKLYRYLLNHAHPDGKSKARFYNLIGYTPDKAEQLRADLLRLACSGLAVVARTNPQGRKYTVVGPINAPNGKIYQILSVCRTARRPTPIDYCIPQQIINQLP